eukprot:2127853-Amphidinium_carterae.1
MSPEYLWHACECSTPVPHDGQVARMNGTCTPCPGPWLFWRIAASPRSDKTRSNLASLEPYAKYLCGIFETFKTLISC